MTQPFTHPAALAFCDLRAAARNDENSGALTVLNAALANAWDHENASMLESVETLTVRAYHMIYKLDVMQAGLRTLDRWFAEHDYYRQQMAEAADAGRG